MSPPSRCGVAGSCGRPPSAVGLARAVAAVLEDQLGALVHDAGPVRERGLGDHSPSGRGSSSKLPYVSTAADEHGRLTDPRRLRPRWQHLDEQQEATIGPEIRAGAVDERVVNITISPGCSEKSTALDSSNASVMYWPCARMLRGSSLSSCFRMPHVCEPGTPRRHPCSTPQSDRASAAEHHRQRGAVGRVLVPAREGLAVGLLHAPRHAPAPEVRADQVLEDVEDVRVLGDLQHPRAEQVGLGLHLLDVGRRAPRAPRTSRDSAARAPALIARTGERQPSRSNGRTCASVRTFGIGVGLLRP